MPNVPANAEYAHEDVGSRFNSALSPSGWRRFVGGSRSVPTNPLVITRRLGHAVRAALFAAFVWHLYAVEYAPYRHQPYGDVDSEAAVRAINAGYPFQLLYEATEGSPPVLKKMSALYGDYGIQIVAALTAGARRMIAPSYQADSSLQRVILLLLFMLTAAAMLAPAVPLLVGMAGVLGLWALFQWGTLALVPPQHWGVAYVALVCAVYLGTVLKTWTGRRIAALILLAALAGFSQLLRQEAGAVPYAAGLALLGSAGIAAIAQRGVQRASEAALNLRRVAGRALGGGLLLIVANGVVQPIERLGFWLAWDTPFAATSVAAHGAGWPLYLSLGYVSNPFNIGWRDPIAQVHARLITPGLEYGDPAFQPTLLREFERIVISRPWLVFRNVVAKAARVHELANRPTAPGVDVAVGQSTPLARFYRAIPWVLLVSLLLLAWRGTAEAVVVWFSSIALAAGASAGALIVFPEYLGGVHGASLAIVLVVPAVVIGSFADVFTNRVADAESPARRLLAGYASLIAACVTVAIGFVGIQAWRYRELQASIFKTDPVAAISEQQFRYAHVFNDLSLARQGRLVAELLASDNPTVARHIDDRRGDFNLFRPEVIVRTTSQVHLIAWMGSTFDAPVPRLYQGATHSLVFICGDCPSEATVNEFPFDSGWTMVNDLEWQGRYRMFSVPLTAKLTAARFFHVAAEKVVALDSSNHATGLRPGLIASARFTF